MIEAIISGAGSTLWTLAAFIVALGVIVTIHEYGHYIIARLSGIRAEVFSIGFGPVIARRTDKRGTVWQIAALPLGGYVRFLGDSDVASVGPGQKLDPAVARQTLEGAPLWARFATVSAGPVFNFVLSICVFAGLVLWQGLASDTVTVGRVLPAPAVYENRLQAGDEILSIDGKAISGWQDYFRIAGEGGEIGPAHEWSVRRDGQVVAVPGPPLQPALVGGVTPRSPAASAGLRSGDVITAIDGVPVHAFDQLRQIVGEARGSDVELTVWRESEGEFRTILTPREQDLPDGEGGFTRRWLIGVSGGTSFFEPGLRSVSPTEALGIGVERTWGIITSSVTGMRAMIFGEISRCNLGGAISIAESTGQAADAGLAQFIQWIAVLSAAIGFLNLLPIPILDGGHLAFYAYEAVTRRPPPDFARRWLSSLGLALVLGLMIFGLTNDISCP